MSNESTTNRNEPSNSTVRIELAHGGTATVTKCAAPRITILSPHPSPPGSTLRGHIEGISGTLELKVRNCLKVLHSAETSARSAPAPSDGETSAHNAPAYRDGETFRIEGRLQNATREMRAHLSRVGE